MRKYIVVGVVAMLVVAVLYMLPRPYEKTLSAYELSHYDSSYQKPLEIHLKGWYASIPFLKDKFKGTLQVGDFKCALHTYITVGNEHETGEALYYFGNKGDWITYGTLYTEANFSGVMILVSEANERGGYSFDAGKGSIIAAPSNSLEEAVLVANRLLKRSFFNNLELPHLF